MPLKSGNKVWTVAEVLTIHEIDCAKNRTKDCAVRDWCREHLSDGSTIEDLENFIYSDPDRGVNSAYLGIKNAHHYDQEPIASELQEYYAEWLIKMPFSAARGPLEMLLMHKVHGGISKDALKILHKYLKTNHPHVKEWYAQDNIAHPEPS